MKNSKINVLIVNDNIEFNNILNNYLIYQEDIVVARIAKGGIEALNLIKTTRPDLVVLDMAMPKLDGGYLIFREIKILTHLKCK